MFNPELSLAVENYCRLFLDVPEAELERKWVWKDHDGEGLRFSFFVTLQELRQLAVILASERTPPTPAQRILGQYHAAYLDLQAAVLGLSVEEADQAPAEKEWPVRRVYAHLLGAELAFSATIRYALEGHRAGDWKPEPMSEADEARIVGMSEVDYTALMGSPLDKMLAFHREFHPKLVAEFASITDAELDLPSTFWEETRFPIRHRLHRFEAHFAQHTVQIDKTLVAIGRAPTETQRLARKIYAALAEAESAMIGAAEIAWESTALAKEISARTAEISATLK
jgi:hypothetical protein